MLKKLLTQLEDYLLPSRCCVCLKTGSQLCPACRVRINKINNFCLSCGKKSKLGLICKKCKQVKDSYDACFFLGSSEDYVIEKSLWSFKFKRNQEVGFILGKILGREFLRHWPKRPKDWQALETILIPLPMTKKNRNRISFNPADIITQSMSQVTDIKILNRQLIIKQGFLQKETKFSWRGESLEETLVIVASESKLATKKMSEISDILKNSKAEIVVFVSVVN
jgi:predicted amidophosphoribosyltransferase